MITRLVKLIHRFKSVLSYLLYIFAIIYIVYFIINLHLNSYNFHFSILPEIFSLVLNILAFVCASLSWFVLLKSGNKNTKLLAAMKSYYYSQIARYIPGNIWSFLFRYKLSENENTTKSKITFFLLVENVNLIGISVLLSLFFILFYNKVYSKYIYIYYTLPVFFLLFLIFYKKVLIFIDKISRGKIAYFEIKYKYIILSFIFFILYWLFFSYSFVFSAYAFGVNGNQTFLLLLNPFAWLIGYISFLTPSGLGIRESVMAFYLKNIIGLQTSVLIATNSRIIFIVSEAIVVLLFEINRIYKIYIIKHNNWKNRDIKN